MNLHSMTGFGTAKTDRLTVEVRSVNHRNLDVRLRLPEGWSALEAGLTKIVRQHAKRGSVSLTVSDTQQKVSSVDVTLLEARANQWLEAADHLGRSDVAPMTWLLAGAVAGSTAPPDSQAIFSIVEQALDAWNAERQREGQALGAQVLQLVDQMSKRLDQIQSDEAAANQRYHERLAERLSDLLKGHELDELRVAQEVAVMAERRDVAEERVRLVAHLKAVAEAMTDSESVGRRVGFLAQELLREVNTIGSKAQDLAIAEQVIALKVLIEQLREQVLNLE